MAFNYTGLAATALSLVTKFGQTVTLWHSSATPDPYEPWKVTDDSTSEDVVAVRVDIPSRDVDGTAVLVSDVRYLLADQGLTSSPVPGDIVEDGGVKRRVALVSTVNPGDLALIHELTCRK